jgi:hypothetical protein
MLRSQFIIATAILSVGGITWPFIASPAVEARAAESVPSRDEVRLALDKAVTFFHDHCAKHGGYDWRYSRDFKLTEGEAKTGPATVWVQPPGTPAVGMAMLEAFKATRESRYLDWAAETARALVKGQMQSGGWSYSIQFDPAERKRWGYRDNSAFQLDPKRKNTRSITTLDDDTTPAALRCLMQVDRALDMKDRDIHAAVLFALDGLCKAQRPNGGWMQNWDRFPDPPPSEADFPILKAAYPSQWSRQWLNDWPGRYYTNDHLTGNMTSTMLLAWDIYRDERYRDSAKRTGDFLILAQMPDPQPAWAQQYDRDMHPCWDRKFEPPAVSSDESQEVIAALLALFRSTEESRYLEPVPRALDYLRKSLLPDGRLSRFYELQTNKPLYFDRSYEITYDAGDVPTHYAFFIRSRLESLQAEYDELRKNGADSKNRTSQSSPAPQRVRALLESLNSEGAWISQRLMKGYAAPQPDGVIESEEFVKNVLLLCRFLNSPPVPR